jgi:hypothetical protein
VLADGVQLRQERELNQERAGAGLPQEKRHGDTEEGPHHRGIELSSGAVDQLLAGGPDRHGLLVRADCRHRVVGVGHGHDAARQRDIGPGQALRIPLTVEALVMLGDGAGPRTEPGKER